MASLSPRRSGAPAAVPSSHSIFARHTDRHKQSKVTVLRIKVAGFKPHPNPYGEQDGQQYSFKILANADLPASMGQNFMDEWMKVNPREQKLTGPIMNAIEDTWRDNPKEFFRVNRGLVVSAESVKFDAESGIAEITFSDIKRHGVLDGGHTLRKVVQELIPGTYGTPEEPVDDESDADVGDEALGSDSITEVESEDDERDDGHDRFLSCEIWTGLSLDQVALLSQGRNTSRTVPPYAIMGLKGEFDPLKSAIAAVNNTYATKVVAFKPNEHVEGLDDFKPVSVLEILQLLMAMDIAHYDSNNHPIEAYKNKSFAAKYYSERTGEYEKMFPVIGDMLALFDKIRQVVPESYDAANQRPRRWSKVLAGEGEKVDSREVEPLFYLDPSQQTKVMRAPNAVFYPIFSAFRAHLREVNGKYEWWDKKAPTTWPADQFAEACLRLAIKIAKAVKGKDHLNAVGRDQQVWATCYETLNSFLFEFKKKTR